MSEGNNINNDTQHTLYKREETRIQYDTHTCVTLYKRHRREDSSIRQV